MKDFPKFSYPFDGVNAPVVVLNLVEGEGAGIEVSDGIMRARESFHELMRQKKTFIFDAVKHRIADSVKLACLICTGDQIPFDAYTLFEKEGAHIYSVEILAENFLQEEFLEKKETCLDYGKITRGVYNPDRNLPDGAPEFQKYRLELRKSVNKLLDLYFAAKVPKRYQLK